LQVSQTIDPKTVRAMRRDPTIFLARTMVRAPIIASSWTVECEDESLRNIADTLSKQLLPLRYRLLESATMGLLDWGWQPYEKVWAVENGLLVIKKLKPLLQDITKITVDNDTGVFTGFRNGTDEDEVELDLFKSLLLNVNVECDNHYGESYMCNAKGAYESSQRIKSNADIYDKKIAGAHWVIRFPDGSSMYNNVETPNDQIAKALLDALENSGSFAIPYKAQELLDQLNKDAQQVWQIELKESSGSGANFEERLSRCDRELVRAFGVPERSILEGQFGTKAEADSHGDFALLGIELLHYNIVEQLNDQLVNVLLRVNYGPEFERKCYIVGQPLSDSSLAFIRQLYTTVLANPDGFMSELASLDMGSIRDRLKVPYTEVTDGSNP
jgi:hypothetical protein